MPPRRLAVTLVLAAACGIRASSSPDAGAAPAPAAFPAPLYPEVSADCGSELAVGATVQPFALPSAAGGKTIAPAGYRGRVLLLNFWGTWCAPCLQELPEFDRLYRRYREHGMTLVAVATDEEPAKVLEFAERTKLRAKLALGGEEVAALYGASTFPFTLIVDGDGVVRAAYEGYEPRCLGAIEADLRRELARRNAGADPT
jgi:thiol-disulfide isomerase/thioredoxin